MNMMRIVFKILDFLLADSEELFLTLGFVLGFQFALLPFFTLQGFLVLILLFILRCNFLAIGVGFILGSMLSLFVDPLAHRIGHFILTQVSSFYQPFGWMHHAPFLPYTKFNHTVDLGRTLIALITLLPMILIIKFSISRAIRFAQNLWYHTKVSRAYAHYRRNNY